MENIDRLNEEEKNARYIEDGVNPDCEGDCNGTGFVNGKTCPDCYDWRHRDELRGV